MKNFGGVLMAIGGGLAGLSLSLLLRRKNAPSVPPPYPKICNNDGGPSTGMSIFVRPPSEELLRPSPIEMHIEGDNSLELVCPSMEKQHDVPHTSVCTQWLDCAQVELQRVGSSDRDSEADVQARGDLQGTRAVKNEGEEVVDGFAEDDNILLEERIGDEGHVVQREDTECDVELVVEGELCTGDDEVDEHERGVGEHTRNDDIAEQEGQNCLADVDEGHVVIDSLVVEGHGSTTNVNQQPPTYSLGPTFNIPCNKVNAALTQIANQPILATKPMASSNISSDQNQLSYVSAVPTEPKGHNENGQLSNALTSSHVPSILFGSMPAAPLCLDPLGTYPLASQKEYSVQPSTSVCHLDEKPTGSTHLQQCQLQCSLNESSQKAPLVPLANSPFMLEMHHALSGPFVATGPYWLESNQMPYSIDTSWGPPGFTSLQPPPPLEVYDASQQVAQFGQSLWPYAFLYPSHGPQLQVYDIDAQHASFGHIGMLYVGDAHIPSEVHCATQDNLHLVSGLSNPPIIPSTIPVPS